MNDIPGYENPEKRETILKAAQKRLGMYGFEKTTMSEIAADVNLSKASLYYYFPDKESLLRAVLSRELDEYFRIVNARMEEIEKPDEMIMEFVRIRHEYFTIFMNLTKFRFSDFYQIRPHFRDLIDIHRRRDAELLMKIFRKGIDMGNYHIETPEELAVMFLEIIHGLRLVVIRNRPIMELTREDYDLMFKKHLGFIEMFMRSIRN